MQDVTFEETTTQIRHVRSRNSEYSRPGGTGSRWITYPAGSGKYW